MPKPGVRQSASRRAAQEARAEREVELEEQLEVEVEEGEEAPRSPLADFLAKPSRAAAARLVAFAHAGLLTLADIQAALAQTVVSLVDLDNDLDDDQLEQRRMLQVQIQRVLKQLAEVVKKGSSNGNAIELTIDWPAEYMGAKGDQVPLTREEVRLPADVAETEDDE